MKGQIALIAFLAVAVLVRPASSGDDHCTADSCPSDGSELQITGESSFQWWDLISAAKHIITTVTDTLKFHAYKQMEKAYNKTAAALEVVKTEIFVQMKWMAGTIYNKTAHIVEGLKNKTTEFAGRVYESIEEFAERVRAVLREEVDSFTEVLWEDGSVGGYFHENGRKLLFIVSLYSRVQIGSVLCRFEVYKVSKKYSVLGSCGWTNHPLYPAGLPHLENLHWFH